MAIKSHSEAVKAVLSIISTDLDRVDLVLTKAAEVDYLPLRTVLQPMFGAHRKRLRPALVLLAAKQNRYDLTRLLPAAAAVELLHTATLVHDDMVDRASTRRGAATVNSALSDRASVLVGDYLFSKAAELAVRTDSLETMSIFTDALMIIADGQLQEMFTHPAPESLREDYYKRIAGKTASLFQASTRIGATLSQADIDTAKALSEYGFNFGMAFQIVDDIFDFAGDEQVLGKPVGSDLRQGTLTLPSIFFLQLFPNDNPINWILQGNGRSEEEVRQAIDMVRESSALELSKAEARIFAENAKNSLSGIPHNPYRQAMLDLADILIQSI